MTDENDQTGLKILLVDDDDDCREFIAMALEAEGMERRDLETPAVAPAPQPGDPLLHLSGGLVGEGYRGDLAWCQPALIDQIGDLAGDHPGLAGTCPGQHQQRPVDVAHRLALFRIEIGHGHWKLAVEGKGSGSPSGLPPGGFAGPERGCIIPHAGGM